MYSPTTPRDTKINPPRIHIENIMDAHPAMVCPVHMDKMVYISIMNPIITERKPVEVIIWSGFTENEVIPSSAKEIILDSGYFVVPAVRVPRL